MPDRPSCRCGAPVARLRHALRWLTEFADAVDAGRRLDCGCRDDRTRYVCGCGRTACEQHRSDPHDREETVHA
ncbi:hypothetical protein [Dactylosporangium salmoneum]|uniref:Uncharacterized protein n=1 Tax=Dactylosporangium salmoneum TaxID=53361 RepID=A0ABP5T9B5_9ACTN